jgi:cyclopropane fatty-acyl-phospholipid synthase-like methyltransferase
MRAPASERRLDWIVDHLDLRPGHHVVEIGGGHGIAASRVLERIGPEGRYLGIDRSEKMTAAARSRNEAAVAEGRARFEVADLLGARVPRASQDRIFAARVATLAKPEALAVALGWLVADGRLYLAFDHPDAARTSDSAADAVQAAGMLGATVVDVRRTVIDGNEVALVVVAP